MELAAKYVGSTTAHAPTAPSRALRLGRVTMGRPASRGASSPVPVDSPAANIRRHEGGRLVWRVPCGDLINRERAVKVFVEGDQVVLVSPPGETARLTTGQLDQLGVALSEATTMAERSR